MGLTQEQIQALLAPKIKPPQAKATPYPRTPQFGPVRFRDTEMRCASRGCGTATYIQVNGIPYCMIHTIKKLNEMILELTGEVDEEEGT